MARDDLALLADRPAHPRTGKRPGYPRVLAVGMLLAASGCGGHVDGGSAEQPIASGGTAAQASTGGSGGSPFKSTGGYSGDETGGYGGYDPYSGGSSGGGIGEEWGTGGYSGEVIDAAPEDGGPTIDAAPDDAAVEDGGSAEASPES